MKKYIYKIINQIKNDISENQRLARENEQRCRELFFKIFDIERRIRSKYGEYKLFEFKRELYILIHGTDQKIERGIFSDTVYTLTNDQIKEWFSEKKYSRVEYEVENFYLRVQDLANKSKYL